MKPEILVRQFNDCINNQDIDGLTELMTEDHAFIDRDGKTHQPKDAMIQGWKHFFATFPMYKNTFVRLETRGDVVAVLGHAYWSKEKTCDPVIWIATIVGNHIREWRVHADTEVNRRLFNLF